MNLKIYKIFIYINYTILLISSISKKDLIILFIIIKLHVFHIKIDLYIDL